MKLKIKTTFFRLAVFLYFFILFCLILLDLWIGYHGAAYSISSLIYWFLLIGIIVTIIKLRLQSISSLSAGLVIFIIGAFLTVVGAEPFNETLMRVSFIFLVVGVIQNIFEFKKAH